MFYSETLLAKNGPLARVWLASNLERKLSKQTIITENLTQKVTSIIGTGANQAPMALRMSGTLLLGVVRIYSRKAKYLMDDAQEALSKIKMAFRPGGNVDLPAAAMGGAGGNVNLNALIMPDAITELDLFAPLPDPEDLLRESSVPPSSHRRGRDPTLLDFGTQLLPESQTPTKVKPRRTLLEDDDLGLDLGLDLEPPATPRTVERSIEVGRRAQIPLRNEPSLLVDEDLGLDLGFGDDDTTMHAPLPRDDDLDAPMADANEDLPLDTTNMTDREVKAANAAALARVDAAAARRERRSASALSSIRSSVERDLERTFQLDQDDHNPLSSPRLSEELEEVQAAQRVKRRKIMRQDAETELKTAYIRQQQEDRSGITKKPDFLPRDPLLLQLMEMQRQGTFVSNIMGDGRMQGWAPELRGILSLEVVSRYDQSERKRKRDRDSGVEDVETDGERGVSPTEQPQLDIPTIDDEGLGADVSGGADDFALDAATAARSSIGGALLSSPHAPAQGEEDELAPHDDEYNLTTEHDALPFDTTEAPLVHPSQSGPVSLGTKNAVHLLRAHFAPDHPATEAEPPTPSKRTKQEALFTDLCPEGTTSRQDAAKMFFELLVLGTKGAIKVEQSDNEMGLPIRVRGKRGLWGDWAEREVAAAEAGAEADAVAVEVEAAA